MDLPLQDLTVLDLTTMLPGPQCSMMLGDFGADVIKIEQPKGGDLARHAKPSIQDVSGMYLLVSRNKKSLTLNLKTPEGKAIFYRLVNKADVVIEGFRPGVVKRLEIDYEKLREINPGLVYCSISGYGQDGPYAMQSGHDVNYLSYAGIMGMMARKGEMPVLPAVQIADIGGGTLMAVIGILMALMARQHSGRGQYVDISMLDGAVSWLTMLASYYLTNGLVVGPGGTKLNGRDCFYEIYRTKDGGYISLGAIEPHLWANLCRFFNKDEFVPWQNVAERQAEMFSFFKEEFLLRDRDEWIEMLKEADVCIAPVYNLQEVFEDPQVLHRKMIFEMNHPRLGTIKQIGFPIKLSESPARADKAPPDLGQHTEEILKELGYSDEEIAHFRQQTIV
jgi:crotonobetainyl-CoA:carnitine CoA-transferase CaiB-like acyl-CoA transferase